MWCHTQRPTGGFRPVLPRGLNLALPSRSWGRKASGLNASFSGPAEPSALGRVAVNHVLTCMNVSFSQVTGMINDREENEYFLRLDYVGCTKPVQVSSPGRRQCRVR